MSEEKEQKIEKKKKQLNFQTKKNTVIGLLL